MGRTLYNILFIQRRETNIFLCEQRLYGSNIGLSWLRETVRKGGEATRHCGKQIYYNAPYGCHDKFACRNASTDRYLDRDFKMPGTRGGFLELAQWIRDANRQLARFWRW